MVPGFQRHVLITPGARAVSAWVEDDYHHMGVTLHHDGATILRVESEMVRSPWSTCPGAPAQLTATFTGIALDSAAGRGDKTLNCTPLHDMAFVAAAHAHDGVPMRYAMTISDAVNGVRVAEISRNGTGVLRLVEHDNILAEPVEVAGKSLFQLGQWIGSLDAAGREAARLLRWAAIIANGRARPLDHQSDATRMPPNCFTFQPGRNELAVRVGQIIDFSAGLTPLG